MLFYILLTVQILICVSMGGLILIQQSEGGALGMGGGPSGFMSARGAGNLLSRLTAIFAVLFFANSIGLTIVGNFQSHAGSAVDQVDTSHLTLNPNTQTSGAAAPAASAPASSAPSLNDLPLANATPAAPVTQAPSTIAPQTAIKPAASNKPVALPAPLTLPSSSSAAAKPHSNIFDTAPAASSSATKSAAAPANPAPTSQQ